VILPLPIMEANLDRTGVITVVPTADNPTGRGSSNARLPTDG
jgi:hypothetical protein